MRGSFLIGSFANENSCHLLTRDQIITMLETANLPRNLVVSIFVMSDIYDTAYP